MTHPVLCCQERGLVSTVCVVFMLSAAACVCRIPRHVCGQGDGRVFHALGVPGSGTPCLCAQGPPVLV